MPSLQSAPTADSGRLDVRVLGADRRPEHPIGPVCSQCPASRALDVLRALRNGELAKLHEHLLASRGVPTSPATLGQVAVASYRAADTSENNGCTARHPAPSSRPSARPWGDGARPAD